MLIRDTGAQCFGRRRRSRGAAKTGTGAPFASVGRWAVRPEVPDGIHPFGRGCGRCGIGRGGRRESLKGPVEPAILNLLNAGGNLRQKAPGLFAQCGCFSFLHVELLFVPPDCGARWPVFLLTAPSTRDMIPEGFHQVFQWLAKNEKPCPFPPC